MSINPQFIYDANGAPSSVILSIADWQTLVEQGLVGAPEWMVLENARRLKAYHENPESAMEAEAFFELLEKDDKEKV